MYKLFAYCNNFHFGYIYKDHEGGGPDQKLESLVCPVTDFKTNHVTLAHMLHFQRF